MLKRLVLVTTVFGFLFTSVGSSISAEVLTASSETSVSQGVYDTIVGDKPTRGIGYLRNSGRYKGIIVGGHNKVTDLDKALVRGYLSDFDDPEIVNWVIDNGLYPSNINDWFLTNTTDVKEFLEYVKTLYPSVVENPALTTITSKEESLFLNTNLLYDYFEKLFGLGKRDLMLITGNLFSAESLTDNFGDGRFVSNKELLNFLYMVNQTFPTQSDITNFLQVKNSYKTDSDTHLDGITLGDSLDKLLGYLGEPDEILFSEFDYVWYTYSLDISKFRQYGVQDGKIVALYSNSLDTIYWRGHTVGDPITSIPTQAYNDMMRPSLYLNRNGQMSVGSGGTYENVTFFRDTFQGDTIEGILVEYSSKRGLSYITSIQERNEHFARQLELLTNSYRVKHGRSILMHHDGLSEVTKKYANRMYAEGFFGHYDPNGQSPKDRVVEAGIDLMVGENLAMGFSSPQDAFSGFVNSQPHWENLLKGFSGQGAGVYRNHYAHLFHY